MPRAERESRRARCEAISKLSLFLEEGCAINVDAKLLHRQKSFGKPVKKARRRDPSVATCAQEVVLIADYVSGQMKPARRAAFEQHLHACPDCAAFLQTYKKTIEITRSFLRLQSFDGRPFDLTQRC